MKIRFLSNLFRSEPGAAGARPKLFTFHSSLFTAAAALVFAALAAPAFSETGEPARAAVLARHRADLATLQLQSDRLCDLLEQGVYSVELYQRRRAELDAEIEASRAAIAALEKPRAPDGVVTPGIADLDFSVKSCVPGVPFTLEFAPSWLSAHIRVLFPSGKRSAADFAGSASIDFYALPANAFLLHYNNGFPLESVSANCLRIFPDRESVEVGTCGSWHPLPPDALKVTEWGSKGVAVATPSGPKRIDPSGPIGDVLGGARYLGRFSHDGTFDPEAPDPLATEGGAE